MVLLENKLNRFQYSVKHPPTVRHACLVNAVTALTAPVVNDMLNNRTEALSKEPKTHDVMSELYILKRDSAWVKKMFMGVHGIDVSVTPVTVTKTKTKTKAPVKEEQKRKSPNNNNESTKKKYKKRGDKKQGDTKQGDTVPKIKKPRGRPPKPK